MNSLISEIIQDDWLIFFLTEIAYASLILVIIKFKNDLSLVFNTWALYFIVDLITTITSIKEEGSYVMLFGYTTGSFIIAAILFFQRRFCWKKFDYWITSLVIICIIAWVCCGNFIALIFGVASETIIGIDLLYRTYRSPQVKHNLFSYTIFLIVSILTLIKAPEFTFEHVGFAISEIILCTLTIAALLGHKKTQSGYLFYD